MTESKPEKSEEQLLDMDPEDAIAYLMKHEDLDRFAALSMLEALSGGDVVME